MSDPMTREDPVSRAWEALLDSLDRALVPGGWAHGEPDASVQRHRPLIEAALAASPADGAVDAAIAEAVKAIWPRQEGEGIPLASPEWAADNVVARVRAALAASPADGAGDSTHLEKEV